MGLMFEARFKLKSNIEELITDGTFETISPDWSEAFEREVYDITIKNNLMIFYNHKFERITIYIEFNEKFPNTFCARLIFEDIPEDLENKGLDKFKKELRTNMTVTKLIEDTINSMIKTMNKNLKRSYFGNIPYAEVIFRNNRFFIEVPYGKNTQKEIHMNYSTIQLNEKFDLNWDKAFFGGE